MMGLKVLKKSTAHIISSIFKRAKDLQQASTEVQALCHDHSHSIGSLPRASSFCRNRVESENLSEPVESIEHIIAHAIGSSKESERWDKDGYSQRISCDERLMNRMPIEYITGEGEFCNTKLKIAAPVFIPEQQTEILVDLLLNNIEQSCSKIFSILEVGCGAGAISTAILRSCNVVDIVAIDTNVIACELTLYNAQALDVADQLTVLHATLEQDGKITIVSNLSNDRCINFETEKFDYVISNPPCTPISELPKWQKEHEDIQARDGGEDGLNIVRPLLLYASEGLCLDGTLLLEVFPSQAEKIKTIINEQYPTKLSVNNVYKDCKRDERIMEIVKIG